MKRIKLLGILLVSATSFISCSDDNQQTTNQQQNTTQQNVQQAARPFARYTDEEVTTFKNLLIEYDFINLTNGWIDAVQSDNIELAFNLHKEAVKRSNLIKARWIGDFDDMVIYIGEIEKIPTGSHDGNPCTRNRDGSNYFGTCTGFGKAIVMLANAAFCSGYVDNLILDEATNNHLLNEYRKCVQKNVCNIC